MGYVLSHLSLIYVEGRHHIDITGSVTADIIMHKPYAILFISIFVIFYPLNQGTGAVSQARDCQPYLFQTLFPSWVK